MSYGHFDDNRREYVITRLPTPRPWENYISNAGYGLRVDAAGSGYSRLPVAPGNRITLAEPGQVFYLRDRESPAYWSLSWGPVGGDCDRYQCRHGLGYSIFEMARGSLHTSLRVFVPLQDQVEIWTATLRNAGERPRKLTLFPFTEWHLAPMMRPWDNYRNYIESHWVEAERLIVARLAEPSAPGLFYSAFAAVSAPVSSYDTEVAAFCAPGGLLAPLAVALGQCRNSDMPGDGRACAAFAVDLDLAPAEEKTIALVVGFAGDAETRARLVQAYLHPEAAERELARVRAWWDGVAQQPRVETPEPKIDRMTNLWLKDNVVQLAGVIRENVRGYRDMLQDAMGLASLQPEAARAIIVTACAHQYADGHAPRQIAYAGGPHDLRVYNDSPLWLVFALTRYLKESGDMALLDEQIGFLEGGETAPAFAHAERAVDWLNERRGWHDLIRIDRGDWCDALDEVGIKEKGVSVWLSQAFHLGLLEFVALCRAVGKSELAERYQRAADALRAAIEERAWDGEWYLAAISDSGRRLGAAGEAAMEIYLNTQSWALIGRTADPARAATALDAADRKLSFRYGPLLLDPPYYAYDPDVGRLSVLRPGCGENGTVYVHAAVFYFLANLMAGRADRALEVLTQICPMMEAQDPAVTHAAPYSYVNSYVGPCYPAHEGRTLTNWYTSSGSWTLLAITDWMLGVRPTYDGLLIDPCLPSAWEHASLFRAWRRADYEIRIAKPVGVTRGRVSLSVDGVPLEGNLVPAYSDGRHHIVEAVIQ